MPAGLCAPKGRKYPALAPRRTAATGFRKLFYYPTKALAAFLRGARAGRTTSAEKFRKNEAHCPACRSCPQGFAPQRGASTRLSLLAAPRRPVLENYFIIQQKPLPLFCVERERRVRTTSAASSPLPHGRQTSGGIRAAFSAARLLQIQKIRRIQKTRGDRRGRLKTCLIFTRRPCSKGRCSGLQSA